MQPHRGRQPKALRRGVLLTVALSCSACTMVGPDFIRPDPAAPADWSQADDSIISTASFELVEWWRIFSDPVLDDLVASARSNNNGLEIAGLRVLEAQAQLGIASGLQYPQVQVAAGDATWISPPDSSGVSGNYWSYGLGASASWEIDFWGRFRRGIESADAAFESSIAAYDQAVVLLTAAVVDGYILVRTLEEQLRIARENLNIQQRSYEITEVLYRNGADSELDMLQAQTLLLATQATLPALVASLKQTRHALATLLGQSPGSIEQLLARGQGIPALPAHTAIGFPADMLRRRPDVRQAELLARAQNALVGLAAADLYPSFSLTGSIGLAAGGPGDSDFGDLFGSDALAFSIGPSFVWPFLNYGRIKNNVRVQDARLQQALIAYRETSLQAAREAEDAIAAYMGARGQSEILSRTVSSALRSNEISTLRYQEGFSDYQRVLDAQQALFTQQQRHVSSQGESVRSLVALYKALGGGWQGRDGMPYLDPETLGLMRERSDWGQLIPSNPTSSTGAQPQD
jgi:NodT family efflux transporter outer membrane factor (OMF) lipoprotein